MYSSLLVAVALLASTTTGSHLKVHHHSHMKFREVTVIADNATCPNGGDVLLCQSASYSCQDDGTGAQKCLERDDSFLDSVDSSITMPWQQCSFSNASLPSKCLFDFQCLCNDFANVECYCMPPDAWRTGRATADNCTTSSGETNACDEGKYCRTKGSYQECATAPYLPSSTSLYSDCREFEKQQNAAKMWYENREDRLHAEEMRGMSFTDRALAFARREKYKIVGATWVASMVGSFVLVSRNPYLSGQQKIVQARVYAQGLTLAVLCASAAFEISDQRRGRGILESAKKNKKTPAEDAAEPAPVHSEAHDQADLWKDMVAAEEQRLKSKHQSLHIKHDEHNGDAEHKDDSKDESKNEDKENKKETSAEKKTEGDKKA